MNRKANWKENKQSNLPKRNPSLTCHKLITLNNFNHTKIWKTVSLGQINKKTDNFTYNNFTRNLGIFAQNLNISQ